MTKKTLLWIIIPILVVALIAGGCIYYFGFVRDIEVLPDDVIATVGDQEIYAYEVEYLMRAGSFANVDEAISYMGESKAMVQKAATHDIVVTEEDIQMINDEIAMMSEQYGGEAQLVAMLSQYGLTMDQYKKIGQMSAVISRFQEQNFELGYMKEITDEEAKAYYDKNFLRAKHILFSNTDEEGTAIDDETVKKSADEVYEKIQNGADFDSFQSINADPGSQSAPDGYIFLNASEIRNDEKLFSMMYNFGVAIMVEEFEKGTLSLQNGEISAPVKSSFGYHIIQRLDINEKEEFFEEQKPMIIGVLEGLQFEDLVDQWAQEYPVKKKARAVRCFTKQLEATLAESASQPAQ